MAIIRKTGDHLLKKIPSEFDNNNPNVDSLKSDILLMEDSLYASLTAALTASLSVELNSIAQTSGRKLAYFFGRR